MAQRYIYLSDELNQKLKGENASRLISNLLEEHFRKTDITKMSVAELERLLKIKELNKKHREELEKIQNGN